MRHLEVRGRQVGIVRVGGDREKAEVGGRLARSPGIHILRLRVGIGAVQAETLQEAALKSGGDAVAVAFIGVRDLVHVADVGELGGGIAALKQRSALDGGSARCGLDREIPIQDIVHRARVERLERAYEVQRQLPVDRQVRAPDLRHVELRIDGVDLVRGETGRSRARRRLCIGIGHVGGRLLVSTGKANVLVAGVPEGVRNPHPRRPPAE